MENTQFPWSARGYTNLFDEISYASQKRKDAKYPVSTTTDHFITLKAEEDQGIDLPKRVLVVAPTEKAVD